MVTGRYTSKILGGAILTFGALVLGFGLVRGEQSVFHYLQLRKSEVVLEQALHQLEAENARLEAEIERIKGSPSYAKRVLRDKFHVTDENERIIFFTD